MMVMITQLCRLRPAEPASSDSHIARDKGEHERLASMTRRTLVRFTQNCRARARSYAFLPSLFLLARHPGDERVHLLDELRAAVLEQDVSVHEPRGVAQTDEFHHFRQQRHDVDRADERGGQPQRRRRARGVRDHRRLVLRLLPLVGDGGEDFIRVELFSARDRVRATLGERSLRERWNEDASSSVTAVRVASRAHRIHSSRR